MIGRGRLALAVLLLAASCGRPSAPADRQGQVAAPASPPVETADVSNRPVTPRAAAAPVIWIGLDGLDWELLDALSAAGRMPNWTRLVSEGHTGRIEAFDPLISPVLWTTAATGADPTVHGVLDFQETEPHTGRKLPISGLSRRVPAVWNAASAAGKKVGVVGWWATHPAEEVNGFFVSDRLAPLLFPEIASGGLAYPAALEAGITQVRARDGAVTDAGLSALLGIPEGEVRELREKGGAQGPVSMLGRIVGATRVSHRVARELYDRERPDLLALYLAGTDEIGHVFAPYRPPKLGCVSEEDFRRYGRVVDAYYALVDRILRQWIRRAQEDGATLLIHSDHGFEWGEGRPCDAPAGGWNTASFWHRPEGVFLAWGARVRAGGPREKVRLEDIAPTVAALLGTPVDRSLPGKVVVAAFERLAAPPPQDVFRNLTVRRLPAERPSEEEAAEYTKKLIALGYISGADTRAVAPSEGDLPGRTEGAWNNLGLYFRETARDPKEARRAFERALQIRSDYASPMFNLAILERQSGRAAAAEQWLFRAVASGYPDPQGTLLWWAIEDLREGRVAPALRVLEGATRLYAASERLAQQLAFVRFQKKDCPGAAAALAGFEASTREPDTLNSLAMYSTCLGKREHAAALLERSLAIRSDQPEARESLRRLRQAPPTGS